MIKTPAKLIDSILASSEWKQARAWGEPRTGHPEGTVGRHVQQQLLPFIDRHYWDTDEYWDLVALAYLHDIGKPDTHYDQGRLAGLPHSQISANISRTLGMPEHLVQVIQKNDRAYSYWRKLFNANDAFDPDRWTKERQEKFIAEFGDKALNLRLLILFHRADNACRRPSVLDERADSVFWFENQLLREHLIDSLPLEGKDERMRWLPAHEIESIADVDFIRPWYGCEPGLETELQRELKFNLFHPLHGCTATSVARRQDCDDVLFALTNHKYPLAMVHLTWASAEFHKEWPSTNLFESWSDWVEKGMYPDADHFRLAGLHLMSGDDE